MFKNIPKKQMPAFRDKIVRHTNAQNPATVKTNTQ